MSFLRLQFTDEGDSTGTVVAEGRCGKFAAEGSACFRISDLETFAERLAAYPLVTTPPVEIRGGHMDSAKPGVFLQEHLALHVYPTDSRGGIAIQMRAATTWQQGDRPGSQSRAEFEVYVTYEAMRHFSRDLKALLRGEIGEAAIEGSE